MNGKQVSAEIVRQVRQRHGVTQVELARRSGVPQSTISAIESARREPSMTLLSSIVESVGDELTFALQPATKYSVNATSREMATIIRTSVEQLRDDRLLRVALTCRDALWRSADQNLEDMIQQPPRAVGDRRWDAFLAATVEDVCAERDIAPPRWVQDEATFIRPFWFLSDIPALHEWEFDTAPAAYLRHGICVARDELASV